jgi:hypothetical protein
VLNANEVMKLGKLHKKDIDERNEIPWTNESVSRPELINTALTPPV